MQRYDADMLLEGNLNQRDGGLVAFIESVSASVFKL